MINKVFKNIDRLYERVNILSGGLGDGIEPTQVSRDELVKGIMVEFEHIDHNHMKEYTDEDVDNFLDDIHDDFTEEEINAFNTSMDIAIDHLAEISDYYTRLDKMETEAESNKKE